MVICYEISAQIVTNTIVSSRECVMCMSTGTCNVVMPPWLGNK